MKNLFIFAIVAMALTIFNGCQKEEPMIPEKEEVLGNYEEMLIVNDLEFSETITIYDTKKENSVELKISSNKKELMDYYLKIQEVKLLLDPPSGVSKAVGKDNIEFSVLEESQSTKLPVDCISFEVTNENLQKEVSNYSLLFETKKLKSYPYPPNDYYAFIKFSVGQNGKINYFPDNTENDELLYKWAYTNSWIGRWYEDQYWTYVWGFDAVDSPMTIYHPLNNMGKYRLGIAIYYDDPYCFTAQSY